MESIILGQCVKGAWRDGWRYFRHHPVFAVLLLPYAWLSSSAVNTLSPDRTPPFRLLTYPSYWRYLGCTWGLAILAPVLVCLDTGSVDRYARALLEHLAHPGVAGLPTLTASVVVAAPGLATRHQALASLDTHNLLGTALAAFGALYLGAPCSAWLYRRYANTLKATLAR
ncbi:hypothetical protein [Paraburkholderia nodosa]|uniref:hypothetical protein n=1 Tax=Paraburkholderia nodosa TaxID=392320 RepID=UPI000841BC37|nr:hypothetical protein [Paraburkholderia nodosa]